MECLSKVVFDKDGVIYPDSLLGTNLKLLTLIDGLGFIGWGFGGFEVESVILGQ